MNQDLLRRIAAVVIISAAIIVADWLFIAAPAHARRDELSHRIQSARAVLTSLNLPAGADVHDARALLRRRAQRIADAGALALEPLRIYDAVLALADEAGVQVDRMDPTAAGVATGDESVIARAFEIEALGAFEQVLAFMDALESGSGHTRIVSATIEPRLLSGRRVVAAIIRTRHFAFDLGDARALLTESEPAR